MKKFVLIPDSYKGTLSSTEICEIMAEGIHRHFEGASVVSVPVADGGEGSVDCFLTALGGKKIYTEVANPYFEKMQAFYGLIDDGSTAIIEVASAAGLPLVENRKDPLKTTTFGVGQLILDAAKKGVKKIILGLGGSCTNDYGCGAAAACGIKFYNQQGKEFVPVGGTLSEIKKIDFSHKDPLLSGIEFITMCDIDNPPYGRTGAAYVFAPQKGADDNAVVLLDNGVKHLCGLLERDNQIVTSALAGGGAAGAFGAGSVAFFNATLKMGIEVVLDIVAFDEMIKDADIIFTGEGKIDGQSLRGKVVIGVASRAKRQNIPVVAVVGGAENDVDVAYEKGVSAVFTINRLPQDFSLSRYHSQENLSLTFDNILRLLKL